MAMNRNRPNRRSVRQEKPNDTVDSLIDRIDRLNSRIAKCNDIDSLSKGHVKGMLLTVVFILSNSPLDGLEFDDDDEETDSDDDDEEPDSNPRSRPRLNLRERWAGTLPTIDSYAASKQRKPPEGPEESVKLTSKQQLALQRRSAERIAAMKSKEGIAGGHPDVYDVTYDFGPNHVCQCGSKLIDHKTDNKLPLQETDAGTMQAYILCDRTRAYIPLS
jgi:hypothetical protein